MSTLQFPNEHKLDRVSQAKKNAVIDHCIRNAVASFGSMRGVFAPDTSRLKCSSKKVA